jgi:glycosyltransferase involved in cell wall biosynthesis
MVFIPYMKISACLVVYNEEKLIKRCLESIKGIVDEIIIVHDGPCNDETLKISKKYTNRIFIRERIGEAEPHRPFCLNQAKGEWVLSIDADEYLSSELRDKIPTLIKNNELDGFNFLSTVYYKGKRVVRGPISKSYKLMLFRRKSATISGIIHDWYKINGKVKDINLIVEHKPEIDMFSYRIFIKKDLKWAYLQAKRYIEEGQAKHNFLFYKIKAIFLFLFIFSYNLFFRLFFLNGILGIKAALLQGMYNFYVNWYIGDIIIKKKST